MRTMSDREKKLQKRFIPINIIICVICIAAIISLFVAPFIKVDVGKFLHSKAAMEFVDETVDKVIGDSLQGSSQEGVDYAPVVAKIVKNVLGKAEGSLTLTGAGAMRVALSSEQDKTAKDELLFGDNALVTELVESIVDGVSGIFETDDGKALIEETMVSTIATTLVKDDPELKGKLTEENVKELTDAFRGLTEVEDGNVAPVVDGVVSKLEEVMGGEMSESDKQSLTDEIQKIYDKTVEELNGAPVTFEAIVCVAVSSNVDLSEIDINDILGGLLGEENNGSSLQGVRATYEDSSGNGEIVTSYTGLLEQIGFGENEKEQLKSNMRSALYTEFNKVTEDYSAYFGAYQYLFYGVLGFAAIWAIQFLFALIHIFLPVKRCTCWYTKTLCWIPGVIWFALTLGSLVVPAIAGMAASEAGALIIAGIRAISSATWISSLCYVLLVAVYCIAYPTKRAIRAERDNY